METIKITLKELSKEEYEKAVASAGKIIREGGLVAFPTETVYGLGANGLDSEAVEKIFIAKGRPMDNPLILHVSDKDVENLVSKVPLNAKKLMDEFWPGPLTIILNKKEIVPLKTTGSLETVGIRMPDNKVALDLIKASGVPIAAPSANISGRPSPTTFNRCVEDLDGRVDMILGWDSSKVGIESTIVDLSLEDAEPEILRPGAITLEDIQSVLGRGRYENMGQLKEDEKPRAPGMKYKHYAPKAEVIVLEGTRENIEDYLLNQKSSLKEKSSIKEKSTIKEKNSIKQKSEILVILFEKDSINIKNEGYKVIVYKDIEEGIHEIFEDLRKADDSSIKTIYIEAQNEVGKGLSLMNRIKKAAGFNIIKV